MCRSGSENFQLRMKIHHKKRKMTKNAKMTSFCVLCLFVFFVVNLHPQSAIRNPQSIRVRSVSENVTRELPLEEYLVGVLRGESGTEDEFEALKAQAVISRTFALKNLGRHAREGFDFCSTTHCQRFVYSNKQSASPFRRSVSETAGEVLRDGIGGLIDGYFHAACGGITANIKSLWGVPAPSYLRGVHDDFCAPMPHYRWTQTIPAADLVKALKSDERTNVGPQLESIAVSKRDATGRAEQITLSGARRVIVRGWDFKIIVGRSLGWQMIKSSRFDVSRSGTDFVFRGSGFGHGLGLCQEGAHVMASRGMSYRQIISHYFPGTQKTVSGFQHPVSSWKTDYPEGVAEGSQGLERSENPWNHRKGSCILKGCERSVNSHLAVLASFQDASTDAYPTRGFRFAPTPGYLRQPLRGNLSSEHFRASFPSEIDRGSVESALRILEAARSDLLQRLQQASVQLPEPRPFEIVIHATTADFIAATGQSGWAAGVTRGRRIELQPLSLLRRRGILAQTLRHELTHAVIEVLSAGRAPRWISEGLAIHVAGESAGMSRGEIKQLAREELELKLSRPAPARLMRELYAAAYREVQTLIKEEGEGNVWRLVAKAKNTSLL
jgi:SpoIID/LytB domain protein